MAFSVSAEILDFCVLGILQKEDAYGYGITQQFSGDFNVSESTLYPVLRRLRKDALLETYDQEYQGRNRRYYRITPKGRARLSEYREDWREYKEMIDNIVSEKSETFHSAEIKMNKEGREDDA